MTSRIELEAWGCVWECKLWAGLVGRAEAGLETKSRVDSGEAWRLGQRGVTGRPPPAGLLSADRAGHTEWEEPKQVQSSVESW